MIGLQEARSFFHNVLPDIRLGQQHFSLDEFQRNVEGKYESFNTAIAGTGIVMHPIKGTAAKTSKEYTLIVVTEYGTKRILLGKKNRGFGVGMYNSFGGKVEPHEINSIPKSAIRELYEETGIKVDHESTMAACRVGMLHFTFEDSSAEMVVHLFRINLTFGSNYIKTEEKIQCDGSKHTVISVPSKSIIRDREEITPVWFDDYTHIPLANMFADDSIWMPYLLISTHDPLHFNGWFHFQPGGQETNTLLHYYVDH
jgi:8-oxo-dGTP pyrophosphatase MutT (NUDIX family)